MANKAGRGRRKGKSGAARRDLYELKEAWDKLCYGFRVTASLLNQFFLAVGRTWILFLWPFTILFLIAKIPQGREALFSAGETFNRALWVTWFLGYLILLAIFWAMRLLHEPLHPEQHNTEGNDEPFVDAFRSFFSFVVPLVAAVFISIAPALTLDAFLTDHPNLAEQHEFGFRVFSNLMLMSCLAPVLAVVSMCNRWGGVVFAIQLLLVLTNAWWALVTVLTCTILITAATRPKEFSSQICKPSFYVLMTVFTLPWPFLGFWVAPQQWLGPLEAIILGVGTWFTLMLLVTICLRYVKLGRGVVGAVLLGLLALFMTGDFNLAEVRTSTPEEMPSRQLSTQAETWLESRPTDESAKIKYPVFIVTAEGGGIRAAYWTACVLSALEDAESTFHQHTFAISSVSGGTLGSTVYLGLVGEMERGHITLGQLQDVNRPTGEADESADENGSNRGPLEAHASSVLGNDFLTASVARMLTSDVMRTTLRCPWFMDRGIALEQSFELAWKQSGPTLSGELLSSPFYELWKADQRRDLRGVVPSLFANGTEATDGRRIILSNCSLDGPFRANEDIRTFLGDRSVPVSTAVMMSARFPGVSPIGAVFPEANSEPTGDDTLYVVDGGFYDNSGAATALDILRSLLAAADKTNRKKIVPIVLMVQSYPRKEEKTESEDPKTSDNGKAAVASMSGRKVQTETTPKKKQPNFQTWSTAFSLLGTLDQVRQGASTRFEQQLEHEVCAAGGRVLRITLANDDVPFPLGWMLSKGARKKLDTQIAEHRKGSEDSGFEKVLKLLDDFRSQTPSGGLPPAEHR